MLEIKIKTLDLLQTLSCQLNVLTYLQLLMQYDMDCHVMNGGISTHTRENATAYLLEKQEEVALQLNALLVQEDFAIPVTLPQTYGST